MAVDDKILYKITVKGRVQGVGFRWSTVREAEKRRINGSVRNLPDGSVYIEAEGTKSQLISFVEWCRKGPGHVISVTTDEYPPVNYKEFRIVF